MFVSIGNSRMDKKFNCTDMTYEDFVSRLSKTKYTAETMEQYRKMPKGQQDNIKDVGGFVLGKLKGGRRKKDCVISRSAITLDVPGTGKHHPWELDCVDQIWAEAIHLYNEGEELFLKGAEAEEAYKMQQEAMESDDREGIVQDYLDRLLPDNWASMDIYQRRAFLGGGEFETVGVKGTVMRERVCIMEIWVECFGKERQNLKKADSYEIEGILNKIGGWKKYDSNTTGKTKVPLYGVQKTFVRMDEKPEETR